MFDFEVARQSFIRRYLEFAGKQIDNSSLPAGSPMYYYCHGCGIQVAVLPETWFLNAPPNYCESCKIFADHGLINELIKEAQNAKS